MLSENYFPFKFQMLNFAEVSNSSTEGHCACDTITLLLDMVVIMILKHDELFVICVIRSVRKSLRKQLISMTEFISPCGGYSVWFVY